MKRPVRKQRVIISTSGLRIEGSFSVPEGLRASDHLNDVTQQFIMLTGTKLYDWKGDYLEDKEFLALNKNLITWMSEL
jgi:hypothetical protein